MTVQSILKSKSPDVVSVRPDASIAGVAAVLGDKRIGAVIVCGDGGDIVGVISERDIVRGLYRHGPKVLDMAVSDLMTSKVYTCGPADSVNQVMTMMTDRHIRHIPVVEDGALRGIISIGDVVKHRIQDAEQEAEAMRHYISTA